MDAKGIASSFVCHDNECFSGTSKKPDQCTGQCEVSLLRGEIAAHARAAAEAMRERCQRIAIEQERFEREFRDLALKSGDKQRASDFEEGAAIARCIAEAISALPADDK